MLSVLQVRIGKSYSEKNGIENGTPQGSIVSTLLFSIMINYVFMEIKNGTGCSLFADDGAKREIHCKDITGDYCKCRRVVIQIGALHFQLRKQRQCSSQGK